MTTTLEDIEKIVKGLKNSSNEELKILIEANKAILNLRSLVKDPDKTKEGNEYFKYLTIIVDAAEHELRSRNN